MQRAITQVYVPAYRTGRFRLTTVHGMQDPVDGSLAVLVHRRDITDQKQFEWHLMQQNETLQR